MGSVDLYQNLCLLIIILLFSKNNFGFEQHLDLSAKSIFLLKVRKKTKILGKYRNFSKNRSFRLVTKTLGTKSRGESMRRGTVLKIDTATFYGKRFLIPGTGSSHSFGHSGSGKTSSNTGSK